MIRLKNLPPYLGILSVNLITLCGVLWFGWTSIEVVFTYLIESFVIGLFNILKMAVSSGNQARKWSTIFFFCIHYFVFIIVQGFFIFFIFVSRSDVLIYFFKNYNFVLTFFLLIFSYSYSFIKNFILSNKYKQITAIELLFTPYGRVIFQAFLIIGGFGFLNFTGFSIDTILLLIIVGLKTLIDIIVVSFSKTELREVNYTN